MVRRGFGDVVEGGSSSEGRKIWGSLDVGLRLRFDCPNITAAFEWAADHENWIIAGELLTASWSAFYLDVRFAEIRTALTRTAAHVAELDPDLHGCVTSLRFPSSLMLIDVPTAIAAADELTRSPLSNFRSIGWASLAFLSAFGAPENVAGLLATSVNERGQAAECNARLSDAHTAAGLWDLFARQAAALMSGSFERSRDLSHELARTWRIADASHCVVAAAVAEALEKLKTGGMNFIDSNSRLYHLESGR